MVLAPVVRGRKGEYGRLLEEMRQQGYARAVVDGELRRLDEEIVLDKRFKHDIAIVIDRLVMKEGLRKRLAESIEAASQLADGIVEVELIERSRAAARSPGRRRCRGRAPASAARCSSSARSSPASTAAPRCPSSSRGSSPSTPPRRLPALPRPRLPAGDRSRADRPRPDAVDLRGGAVDLDRARHRCTTGASRGGRREPRDRHRHALAGPGGGRPADPARGHRRTSATRSPTRTGSGGGATTAARFEGIADEPRAALREHRLGEDPRADRGPDGAAAVPGLRRRPAAAGEPRGHGRRAHRSTSTRSCRRATRWSGSRTLELTETERAIARLVVREIAERLAFLDIGRDRLPDARAGGDHALGRRGAADPARDPDRLAASWASSTSSTSPRSGSTSATTRS